MEDIMYVTIRVHQSAAILSFILMPVLLIAKKGTPFHKKFGKFLFVVSIILVAAAILSVINPFFPAYWADDIARHNWANFLSIFGLGTAFLWWVAAFYGYFFCSVLRVWPRLRAHNAGARASNWFDYLLTAIALSVGCYYGAISVVEALTSSYGYPRLLPMSLAFVGFGLWDLITYFRPINSFRVAALTHGSRLFAAWWMLLIGILIRQGQHVAAGEGQMGEYIVTGIVLVLFAALLFHWNRQVSAAASP